MKQEVNTKDISQRINAFDRNHTISVYEREGLNCAPSIRDELDAFVRSLSKPPYYVFTGIGERWQELDEHDARNTLIHILCFDLAYSKCEEIPQAEADLIIDEFLSLFDSPRRFFSNGRFRDQPSPSDRGWGGYGSVANATFETGVVVVSADRIGMLWCHDED